MAPGTPGGAPTAKKIVEKYRKDGSLKSREIHEGAAASAPATPTTPPPGAVAPAVAAAPATTPPTTVTTPAAAAAGAPGTAPTQPRTLVGLGGLDTTLNTARRTLIETEAITKKAEKAYLKDRKAARELGFNKMPPLEELADDKIFTGDPNRAPVGKIWLNEAETRLRSARIAYKKARDERAAYMLEQGRNPTASELRKMAEFVRDEKIATQSAIAEKRGGVFKKIFAAAGRGWMRTPPLARGALMATFLVMAPAMTAAGIAAITARRIIGTTAGVAIGDRVGKLLYGKNDRRFEQRLGEALSTFDPARLDEFLSRINVVSEKYIKGSKNAVRARTILGLAGGAGLGWAVMHPDTFIHSASAATLGRGFTVPSEVTPPFRDGVEIQGHIRPQVAGVPVAGDVGGTSVPATDVAPTAPKVHIGDSMREWFRNLFTSKPPVVGSGSAEALATEHAAQSLFGKDVLVHKNTWSTVEELLKHHGLDTVHDQSAKDFILDKNMQHLRSMTSDQLKAIGFKSGNIDIISDGDKLDLSSLEDPKLQGGIWEQAQKLSPTQLHNIAEYRAGSHGGGAAHASGHGGPQTPDQLFPKQVTGDMLNFVSKQYGASMATAMHDVHHLPASAILDPSVKASSIPNFPAVKTMVQQLLDQTHAAPNTSVRDLISLQLAAEKGVSISASGSVSGSVSTEPAPIIRPIGGIPAVLPPLKK